MRLTPPGTVEGQEGEYSRHTGMTDTDNQSQTIEPARKLLETQDLFLSDSRQLLSANEYETLSTKDLVSLEGQVQFFFTEAKDEKSDWARSRPKASQYAQSFVTKFSDFLESYSGIVEIVKGADQQYGGLAYGTLSLFLVVCPNMHCSHGKLIRSLGWCKQKSPGTDN